MLEISPLLWIMLSMSAEISPPPQEILPNILHNEHWCRLNATGTSFLHWVEAKFTPGDPYALLNFLPIYGQSFCVLIVTPTIIMRWIPACLKLSLTIGKRVNLCPCQPFWHSLRSFAAFASSSEIIFAWGWVGCLTGVNQPLQDNQAIALFHAVSDHQMIEVRWWWFDSHILWSNDFMGPATKGRPVCKDHLCHSWFILLD